MLTTEYLAVLIFLSLVSIVYALAFATAIRWLLQKLRLTTLPDNPTQIWSRRIVLTAALLGLGCIAYGYFVEPYWPSISRVQITTSKLARGSRPLRLVHISDLHSDPNPRLEERLPDLIAREKPDAIVFTGDCINSPEGLPVFKKCLANFAAIAPTFAVKGNWDVAFWRNFDLFAGTGVQELDGTAVPVRIGDSTLWIAGVSVGNEVRIQEALQSVPDGAPTLFLYHSPDLIQRIADQHVDFYCSGHTHGGQVALPFYGALVTLSEFGKQYEAGLYKENQTWLYVNRGIGMEGGYAPRVRFCARPEITVIEIAPEELR